ncbi:MAG: S41 family peptidase [Candidatus Paceibacterota bacterium]|jgi:carboxyl-terminal processing protease
MTPYGKKVTLIGAVILLLGASFMAGAYVGYSNKPLTDKVLGVLNKNQDQPQDVDFAPFWQAWKAIDDHYVATHQGLGNMATGTDAKKITSQDRVYGAIEGMFKSLGDPYTVFFPPEEAKLFQDEVNGSFSGVGMEIGIRDGALTVVAPLKDTPAFRAGIKSGDRIVKIDDKSAADLPVDVAVQQIRGEKGTKVKITIGRNGEPQRDITITRDTIVIPTISIEGNSSIIGNAEGHEGIRPDGIFVIRLYNFSAQASDLFRQALQKFVDSGSDKLLLDLRGNPGGYLDSAVDIASWFVPAGRVVVSERSGSEANAITKEHKSRGTVSQLKSVPRIAILIDRGSASASEILAGALQDEGVAKLIGERSFGKGSVQELIPITTDTEAKITIARWFTPKGRSISDSGLTPDYPVTITKDNVDKKIDPQFDKALAVLKDNSLWK